jgi:hypothetical protein
VLKEGLKEYFFVVILLLLLFLYANTVLDVHKTKVLYVLLEMCIEQLVM